MKYLINYGAWYLNKLFDHPYVAVPPIVLSGVGRSGTTALRMSLGTHPDIIYNRAENNIVMDILQTGLHNCTYPSRKVSMQMSQCRYDKAFRNLILNVLYPRPPLAMTLPKRWLTSTDINPCLVRYFRQLFPDTRLVYLVRDGVEVVSSRMVFDGFKDRPFTWQCEVWAKAEEMIRWGVGEDYFYLIRHESLLEPKSIQRVLSDLCSWLGLKYDTQCAEALSNNTYHPTTFGGEAASAARDLHSRKSRWEYWTDEQREIFVKICSSAMDYLGYEIPWCARTPN